MAVIENFPEIIHDMHVASGHKRKTKIHKKITENFYNIFNGYCQSLYFCMSDKYERLAKAFLGSS